VQAPRFFLSTWWVKVLLDPRHVGLAADFERDLGSERIAMVSV
jgi:hypothetical protein